MKKKRVSIIMGSASDLKIMEKAAAVLEEFGIVYEMRALSAHRSPGLVLEYANDLKKRNVSVVIAGAGMAAHLPGVIAGLTTLPVIGVPIESKGLGGLDALLSIVQMPPGVPVATVSVGGAKNAALLAVAILSLSDSDLAERLEEYRKEMLSDVSSADKELQKTVRKDV